jgi:hypothetical protein
MKQISVSLGIALVLLAGCAGSNGTYVPACVAFEGASIKLDSGRFVFDRFTDAVEVDDDGNVLDAFPGYPMPGSYRFDGNVLHMESDSGTTLPRYFLVESAGKKHLLTQEQYDAWTDSGTVDPCALTRGAGGS